MAGRPLAARLSADQVAEARRRHSNGESIRALARALGVAHSTLAAHLRAAAQAESAAAVGVAAPAAAPTRTPPPRTQGRGEDAAVADAAAAYVERLEEAYQRAFAAIATLLGAIERVRELRGQEHVWEEANKLGLAPLRPEPWRVRVGHDERLRRLSKRFSDAINSGW